LEITVGQRIAELRREAARRRGVRRYTQDDLARDVGVVKGSVAKWETDVQVPTGENLVRLARALETTPAAILGGEERAEDVLYQPGEGEERRTDGAELFGDDFTKVTRTLSTMGAPGDMTMRKRAALDAYGEYLATIGPKPEWWYELDRRLKSDEI
jgi:transcriptional regulator with XRE-family HTH domain